MEAYLDNSATTYVTEDVKNVVVKVMTEEFGNPSSKHLKGLEAEKVLRSARETLASTLHCNPGEIFFTSGATESNNWAIREGAFANRRRGKHVITTAVEHPSVLMPVHHLMEEGYEATFLRVDGEGHIDLEELKAALRPDTTLVSIMMVNNEVGALEPIEEAGKIIKAYDRRILFHVDAVQGYGKLPINPSKLNIDLMSISGHKLHAPKGTGFLYVKNGAKITPMMLGGGQQGGMRSGTDNVPGAAGLAQAAKDCYDNLSDNTAHFQMLKDRLVSGLKEMDQVVINSITEPNVPWIVSAAFVGVRSEVLLHALEDKGVSVSAGSACSSNKKLPVSTVLQEMHLSQETAEATLRFSFSRFTTPEEVDYALECIRELVPMLRRYSRR